MKIELHAGQLAHIEQLARRDYKQCLEERKRRLSRGQDDTVEVSTLRDLGLLVNAVHHRQWATRKAAS